MDAVGELQREMATERQLAGPQDTFVTINNDTVYSMAQLDLSVGPLRLEVPETGERYYVLQFVDAWTNNIAYAGTRATGNGAGRFLIVPPDWDGELPEAHTPIQGRLRCSRSWRWVACGGPEDSPAVRAVQDALVLEPLEPDPPAAVGIPELAAGVPDELAFWERARAWSTAFAAPAEDAPYAERYAPLGVADAASSYAAYGPEELRRALVDGERAGAAEIEELSHHGSSPVVNGWTVGMHAFDYNLYALGLGTIDDDAWKISDPAQRIVERALACRLGLWGNHG